METTQTNIPGQGVLPGLEDILRIESARLKKPEQEAFCWEFVTNGGKPGPAYLATINKDVPLLRAQKNASDLLKKPEIRGRIKEISAIIQRKYEQEVLAYRRKALQLDPGRFFHQDGRPKRIHELPEEDRVGVGLEAKIVDGCLHYVPVFPSPEKAADALQKICGMNKERTEVTGKDGGPIQTEETVTIYIPANGRD